MRAPGGTWANLKLYIQRQAANPGRYVLEQLLITLLGWIPTVIGVALRAVFYRLILHMDGVAAIEDGVRIRYAGHIRLGRGVYIDHGVYLHACPDGITIGDGSFVMHHAELHVYNFRDLPHAFIRIGRDSLIGEFCVIRGPGGVSIGDRVYLSPGVHIYSSNHIFSDTKRSFVEQGVVCKGVVIEDDTWIGASAIILDGVRVGKGSVVAAGAVVTTDIPPHTLVAGVPARVIKKIGTPSSDEDKFGAQEVAHCLRWL
ncbi:MAG: transferase [Ardenticatenia bacterium]|jgi:acetyltransferase-like isoleucine patch superfamily enzyme|nr:MAG: transferase [Ardenticatenia bacterium]